MISTLMPSMQNALFTLAAGSPADHVYNHYFLKNEEGYWLWSGNQGNLVLSLIILVLGGLFVASKVKTGEASEGTDRYVTKNKFAHMIEVICVYLREEVARPLLGERTNKIMPFLWTIFFFILVNNLLGLVPLLDIQHLKPRLDFINSNGERGEAAPHWAFIGGTATQNIWVTAVLAIIACIFFNGVAIKRLGIGGYLAHMTAGAPFPASIIIFVLELASQLLIKPFALALRLFANMTAGHILLATLFSFAGLVVQKGFFIRGPVTLISILGGTGIMFLEIFVAFMQAFVFMFLVTVFIALMDHHDHDHEHEHGHAHGHEHAHA
jgi:F-type H+-transporting ATPase subunit a